ncbi:MAG: hypothetical protein JOZ41_06640, partial [Chloroflexi bacterium]|nr:hypothetical protein [Chloroflexota bacterium]
MVDDMISELGTLGALAERLVSGGMGERPMRGHWTPPGPPTVIRPAAFPPELQRLEVPIPAESRLIGSSTRGAISYTFLDASLSPLDVLRFYEGELSARGWIRTDGGPRSALWQGDLPSAHATFFRSSSGPSLHLQADRNGGGGADVWLQLETDPQRSHYGASPAYIPPPPVPPSLLSIPLGGRAAGGSGPSQRGGIFQEIRTIEYSTIALAQLQRRADGVVDEPGRPDVGPDVVAHYYAGSLTEEGWTRRRAGRTGPAAWSTWTCADERGQEVAGFLLVFRQVDGRYAVQLDRDLAPGSREEAERESREQVRRRAREATGGAVRVETAGAAAEDAARALREVLLRIALPPPGHRPPGEPVQLVAGRLPEALPIQLPLPPVSRVLGSVVTGSRTAIFLESRTRPRALLDFYREHLSSPAWSFFGELPRRGGFLPQWLPDPGMLEPITGQFCSEVGGPGVTVTARVGRAGVTEARITVETDPGRTPCGNIMAAADYRRSPPQLPVLVAPPGSDFVEAEGYTGSGTDHGIRAEARGYLYAATDLQAVAGHYGRQLAAAGWERQGEGRDAVTAWSAWRWEVGEGEREDALFLAVRPPGTDR